jgi:hypothetical protein
VNDEELERGRELEAAAFCAPWEQGGPFLVRAEDECSEDCEQEHDCVEINAPDEYPAGGQHVCHHVALTCSGLSRFAEANGALIVWLRNNAPALLDAAEENAKLRARIAELEVERARAWDEGHLRGQTQGAMLGRGGLQPTSRNPYRKDGE